MVEIFSDYCMFLTSLVSAHTEAAADMVSNSLDIVTSNESGETSLVTNTTLNTYGVIRYSFREKRRAIAYWNYLSVDSILWYESSP